MADQDATTVEAFRTLDESEVFVGYMDGYLGEGSLASCCSPSYRHGWRNGMIEGGHMPPDAAYLALAEDFRRRYAVD